MILKNILSGITSNITSNIIVSDVAAVLADNPIVDLASSGITFNGSNQITGWTNSGTGGASYDLITDTVQAGFILSTHNGNNVADSDASVGALMRPALAQSIATGGTCFIVVNPSASNRTAVSGFSNLRWRIMLDGSDRYTLRQNSSNIVSASATTGPRVVTGILDTTDTLTVSGNGTVTGDSGSSAHDYCTLFSNHVDGSRWNGWVMRYMIYDRVLTAGEIASTQKFLEQLI